MQESDLETCALMRDDELVILEVSIRGSSSGGVCLPCLGFIADSRALYSIVDLSRIGGGHQFFPRK